MPHHISGDSASIDTAVIASCFNLKYKTKGCSFFIGANLGQFFLGFATKVDSFSGFCCPKLETWAQISQAKNKVFGIICSK